MRFWDRLYKKAAKWNKKAAERGYAESQYSLGLIYYECKGVEQDYKEASKWFLKAAEQEHAGAQYNLGLMCYEGKGVIEDYTETYKWILLAGSNGYDVSKVKKNLKTKMTPLQIAVAQELAKAFIENKNWHGN